MDTKRSSLPENFSLTRKRSSLTETGPSGVEVTLLQAQNLPQKPVLAIRAGNSLKHVDLSVNDPFRIPVRDFKDGGSVNVSLYQKLGTQQILDVDELESICSVPVRIHDGSFSQVKLRVRRGRPVSMSNPIGCPDEYFSTHQLEDHIQRLFEIVLKTQPADPYKCMIEELRKIKEKDVAARGPKIAKVPQPPSSEPGAKQRPSALKSRSKRSIESSQDALPPHMQLQPSVQLEPPRVELLSNREVTRELLRALFKYLGETNAIQSTTPGGKRDDNRMLSIQVCYHVRRMVFEACAQRPACCDARETLPETPEACLEISGKPEALLPRSEETPDSLVLDAELEKSRSPSKDQSSSGSPNRDLTRESSKGSKGSMEPH